MELFAADGHDAGGCERVTGKSGMRPWELAHDLHPHESLVQERGARPGLRTPATRPVDPHQVGGGVAGQHHRQGPSRRHGGSKKNGPKAIGKSRGGWTTKIHLVAADARTALTFALSPGQAHDGPEGRKLLTSLGPQDAELALVMDRCSASITLAARVASFRNVTHRPQKDRTAFPALGQASFWSPDRPGRGGATASAGMCRPTTA